MHKLLLSLTALSSHAFLARPRALKALRKSSSDNTDYGESEPAPDGILPEKYIYVGAMVSAQDQFEQWYAAEVVETRQNEDGYTTAASVKYLGWEDWPVEWVRRDQLGYMPKVKPIIPDEMLPPEQLARKLAETKRSKETYQFQKFREAFAGDYAVALGERYVEGAQGLEIAATFPGSLSVAFRVRDEGATAHDGWALDLEEARGPLEFLDAFGDAVAGPAGADGEALALGREELLPETFGGVTNGAFKLGGATANGEAFSCARADADRLAAEVWLASEDRIVQLRVLYARGAEGYAFRFCDVARLVRTSAPGLGPDDALDEIGVGVYDVHSRLRQRALEGGIHELRLGGRMTAAFPRVLTADVHNFGGCLSLDWNAPGSPLRVQVDRVFDGADGSLLSLEITDILKDQAEEFPAQFNF